MKNFKSLFNFSIFRKKDDTIDLYKKMYAARLIEDTVRSLPDEKKIKRIYYGTGQEAGPIGVIHFLQKKDYLIPPYRGIAHVLAKGMSMDALCGELLSLRAGPLEGIGNPGSFTDPSIGIFPNSDILGSNFAVAVGMGLAARMQDGDKIVTMFFGEGASTRSTFYGSLNLSAIWGLPILWVCENNKYSLATRYERTSETSVAEKAAGFGIRTEVVDGNDVIKIANVAERLIKYVRIEKKPILLELDTFRMADASEADNFWYKNIEEWRRWKQNDPLDVLKNIIQMHRLVPGEKMIGIEKEVFNEIQSAFQIARKSGRHTPEHVRERYGKFFDREKHTAPALLKSTKKKMMVEAIRDALLCGMEENEQTIIIGEDVGFYGGRRGVTKGFLERFGDRRVIDTPLNEELFVGIGIGAAQAGLRPIIEFSHAAFLMLAAGDIHRMGFWDIVNLEKFSLPIIVRASIGSGYDEYGEELGLSPISSLLNWKGVQMVMPSNAFQAYGLMRTALRSNKPTIFFEHRLLYKTEAEVSDDDYFLPLDKGAVVREGKDCTIVSYGYLTKLALAAAAILEKYSIQVEIVDLISLKPLDKDLIIASVKKTKKILILDEEAVGNGGLSASISNIVRLSVPDVHIAELGGDVLPLPFGEFAKTFLPKRSDVINAVLGLVDNDILHK